MLSRWDPFREMVSMRRAMDRLIENSFSDQDFSTSEWALALDVVEQDDQFMVKASLPGMKPEDLEITFNKGMLTIKGEIKDESDSAQGQYHMRERRYGIFTRSIALPSSVQAENIQADYQDGILTLHLPKAEEVKPKRIAIQSHKNALDSKAADLKD